MDLKEKNVKSIFDEIGFMNNKRLGRCFQTRRKKYYFGLNEKVNSTF